MCCQPLIKINKELKKCTSARQFKRTKGREKILRIIHKEEKSKSEICMESKNVVRTRKGGERRKRKEGEGERNGKSVFKGKKDRK